MRKYIFSVLAFFGMFVLSGCGGGSDNISDSGSTPVDTTGNPAVNVIPDKMTINGNVFSLNISFVKKIDSSYKVELSDFDLTTYDCILNQIPVYTPSVLHLDGGVGSTGLVNISGTFDANCSETSYMFSATQKTTKDGKVDTRRFSIVYDSDNPGGTTPVPSSGFFNATTPLEITQADTAYEIKVQMLEDGYVASGKLVDLKPFSSQYGAVSSYQETTATDGYALFSYTSPSTLPANGTSTILELTHDDNGTIITQNIVLKFNNTGIPPIPPTDTTGMILTAAPDTVNVVNAGDSAVISLYLVNASGPVANTNIKANWFDPNSGTLNNYTATTNDVGQAVFNYTAPVTLPTSQLIITFDVENPTLSIAEDVTVNFASSGGSTDYSLINVSNIIIEHGSQKEDVKAQLTYKGIPIAGKAVQMLAFSAGHGTILNSYSVITDSVGYATFVYMAPETLDDVNGTTINLTIQFDEELFHLEANASIEFSETQDNIDGNVTLPIVVIPSELRNVELDSNNQTFLIAIQVFKDIAPYGEGTVKVELPDKVLNGIDVGQFLEYEVAVNPHGTALFSYTGPSNLQSLIDNDDNESIFKFYHLENTANKQEMKVVYKAPSNPNVDRNYGLEVFTSGDFSMGIPNQVKTFNVLLTATDASGNEIILGSEENITKITVSSENTAIAQIWDSVSKTSVDSLILAGDSFTLKSKTLSGLVPVKVIMEFKDVNGDPQVLTTIVNVRVFSGPASAISISYVSTGQDVERAKYIETLAISVTDEYGNRVNTRPNISLGAIVGYAVDGHETSGKETNETKRLFYGRSDIEDGIAEGMIDNGGDSDVKTTEFVEAILPNPFTYVNVEGNNTDKLVIFGERKNYEAMGKWDFIKEDNSTLSLQDNYYGINRDGLYYAVGHNYYQDLCREDGREWIGSTDSETYQLDEEGTATVTYKYDYHLTGKDALIWVNLDGIQPDTGEVTRVGETVKHTLRGTGFTKAPTSGYSLDKGTSGYGTFIIWHENAPERYRNGHFGYAIAPGSTCGYRVVAQSNPFDARTCNNKVPVDTDNDSSTPDVLFGTNDGTSHITFYLQAAPDKGCTFDIENIMVSSEF